MFEFLGFGQPEVPYPGLLRDIVRLKYEAGSVDCSNKAGRYCRALWALGYQAEVVNFWPQGRNVIHSVVRIPLPEGDILVDATDGSRTRDLAKWGELNNVVSRERVENDKEYA